MRQLAVITCLWVSLCSAQSFRGADIQHVNIKDSISDGFSIVAPGSKHGQGTLTNAIMASVDIPNYGIGVKHRHGLWIKSDARGSMTISNSTMIEYKNYSSHFVINWQ